MKLSGKLNRTLPILKAEVSFTQGRKVFSTLINVQTNGQTVRNRTDQPGKILETMGSARSPRARPLITPQDQPRASSHTNDNYGVNSLQGRLLARNQDSAQRQISDTCVNLNVVPLVHTAPGLSQKKEVSPGLAACFSYHKNCKVKYVKGASCVTQLSCVKPVTNVKNAASNLPVGARLQNFWQTWLNLGAGPKIVQMLKEGYTLPFRIRPNLARSPTAISGYVNPHRNSYLLEALLQLMSKTAVELVQNKKSLGFFNRLFLVPKPNN